MQNSKKNVVSLLYFLMYILDIYITHNSLYKKKYYFFYDKKYILKNYQAYLVLIGDKVLLSLVSMKSKKLL